jgi:hypothetical protein
VKQADLDPADVKERLRTLKSIFSGERSLTPAEFREIVKSTRLFDAHADAVEEFIREELP